MIIFNILREWEMGFTSKNSNMSKSFKIIKKCDFFNGIFRKSVKLTNQKCFVFVSSRMRPLLIARSCLKRTQSARRISADQIYSA